MDFGFSYIGMIYLLMLFIPNILWTKHQPKDYKNQVDIENKIFVLLEKIGEISVSCIVLIFTNFNLHTPSLWMLWLLLSFIFMIAYELWWIRYFKSPKTMQDFYSSFMGFPVAGASLPVIGFFLLGIYGKSILLMIATIILGIGHIGIHLQHKHSLTHI